MAVFCIPSRCEIDLSLVERCDQLQSPAFPLFPASHCIAHCVFRFPVTPLCDGLANEAS